MSASVAINMERAHESTGVVEKKLSMMVPPLRVVVHLR